MSFWDEQGKDDDNDEQLPWKKQGMPSYELNQLWDYL